MVLYTQAHPASISGNHHTNLNGASYMYTCIKRSILTALTLAALTLYLTPYDVSGQNDQTVSEASKPAFDDKAVGKSDIKEMRPTLPKGSGAKSIGEKSPAAIMAELRQADIAITAKANQIGFCGAPMGDTQLVHGGWMRVYKDCEIYFFNKDAGAREVHGEILTKYHALRSIDGVLGFPVTDESGTPDGVGRFNHFQGGSIYWTPRTQSFLVHGPIRDAWAAQGWERGPLGYPVADEYVVHPFKPSATQPPTAWSLFENGAIVQTSDGAHPALAAEVPPDRLRCVLRSFVDQEIHKLPDNIGLHPPVETLSVSNWTYGPVSRKVTFRLHGFHDNGLAPDTDFELDMGLRFSLAWSNSFSEPIFKVLVAWLDGVRVETHGLSPQTIADRIRDGVIDTFNRPDPDHSEVVKGSKYIGGFSTGVNENGTSIDVIGTVVTAQGGLQILVPAGPLVNGNLASIRQVIAQDFIEKFLESSHC
jgi:hypothetical protein